jgi:hypothetical protein
MCTAYLRIVISGIFTMASVWLEAENIEEYFFSACIGC